jgi:hypothetical protein
MIAWAYSLDSRNKKTVDEEIAYRARRMEGRIMVK